MSPVSWDQRSPTLCETSSLHSATTRGYVMSSFWHGTNHNALSGLREKMAARIFRKAHDIEQTQKVIPLIFWETSFGQNVSIFLVFTYLIWILGSKLILGTCLVVGLLSLMIILITASLSAKMHSWDSPHKECVLVGSDPLHSIGQPSVFFVTCWVLDLESRTASVSWWPECVGWVLSLVECETSVTMPQRSRACNPSIHSPASREMTSDSVELRKTEVWTSTWRRQKFDFQKNTRHHLRLILSPQGRQQRLSVLEQTQSPCCAVVPTWLYWR